MTADGVVDIERIALDLLTQRLGSEARIVSVSVSEDVDSEGDQILVMKVVFDGRLDASKAASALRHLRPALFERKESRFPLLSFVTRRDAEAAAPA